MVLILVRSLQKVQKARKDRKERAKEREDRVVSVAIPRKNAIWTVPSAMDPVNRLVTEVRGPRVRT